jgi:hypothetical protein
MVDFGSERVKRALVFQDTYMLSVEVFKIFNILTDRPTLIG